jgi:Tfp pilus assembly protein FimV
MAKQSRRAAATRRRQETVRARVPVRTAETPKAEVVDLRTEYHYVLADLKRFGILAVTMIALLVLLALVL